MKKVLLTLLCASSLFTNVKAQQYYPILDSVNIWTYTVFEIGERIAGNSDTCGYPYGNGQNPQFYTASPALDSVIHSHTYMRLGSVTGCLYGFIREDTTARKVYFQDTRNSPEILLYDFSMQVGDSININFLNSYGYFFSGYYVLDSVKPYRIYGGMRQAFYLNCTSQYCNTLIWIEGVGNQGDLVYPYSGNQGGFNIYQPACNGFPYNQMQLLTCFRHNQLIYYDSCAASFALNNPNFMWYNDVCSYGNIPGGVHEVSRTLSVKLLPNPANNELVIYGADNTIILIKNILGQTLYQSAIYNPQSEIDVTKFPSGLYFAEVIGEKGRWVGKFVKQ